MGPLEDTQTREDADDDSHQRLHIVIRGNHRGTQNLLGLDNQNIADEGAKENHIGRLQEGLRGQWVADNRQRMGTSQRQEDDGGPEEHPLVDGEDAVLADELVEQRQVEGVGELRPKTTQVATNITHLVAGMRHRGEDEHEGTTTAQHDAQHLLTGNWLLQDECRQQHGEDRHRRGDDAGIDGRRERQTDGVATLVAHDAEDGCAGEGEHMLQGHMLALDEQRGRPEQQGSTSHTDEHHRRAIETVGHSILAQRGHQTPDGTGGKHRQMGIERLSATGIIIHSDNFFNF